MRPRAPQSRSHPRTGAPSRQIRVLIVDDHQPMRGALEGLLAERGYLVRTASDGLHALDILQTEELEPDVILVDFLMPNMDGLTFVRALDQLPEAARTALVCISHRQVPAALRSRCIEVLEKPFDAETLLAAIERATAGR